MEERRAHPTQCLMQEEWGMIKQYMKSTAEETASFRHALNQTLDQIRAEDKARFEILLNQVRNSDVSAQRDYEEIRKDLKATKGMAISIITWGIVAVLGVATAWGSLTTTVMRNTDIIFKNEASVKKNSSDIEVLKEKHNGGSHANSRVA